MASWNRWLRPASDALPIPPSSAVAQFQAGALPTPTTRRGAPGEEDRTTRIYNRASDDEHTVRRATGGMWSSEETTKTAQLSNTELERLLLETQADDEEPPTSTFSQETASEIKIEVSKITHEELEAFRRSLGNGRPDATLSKAADAQATPVTETKGATAPINLQILAAWRKLVVLTARAGLFLWRLGPARVPGLLTRPRRYVRKRLPSPPVQPRTEAKGSASK